MTSPSSPVDIIEKAMEGVRPGTWVAGYSRPASRTRYVYANNVSILETHDSKGRRDCEANADYIAACSPDRMRVVLDLARQAEAMKREMAEKDARIAALEAGLRPFAAHKTADGLRGPDGLLYIPDDHPLLFNGLGSDARVTMTVGDVRRARALIGGGNAED